MRLSLAFAFVLLLTACSSTQSDAARVFEAAFGQQPPANVAVLHGYRLERRKFFVISKEMWRLHLGGPGAKQFVRDRWPDLEAATVRAFVQGSQTPWFAPGRDVKYVTLVSPANPAVMVMMTPADDEVFVAYDAL